MLILVNRHHVHALIYEMSSSVDLTKSQLEMVFVIQDVHQISIEWMDILERN